MRRFILFYLIFISIVVHSQISLNTTGDAPDPSAAWDIQFSDKGILIPRISLSSTTDATTIPSPATSLLVYNTNAGITGGQGVGYYYNAGTQASPNWVKVLVGKEAWMITGNDNTDPATNFLGTTNDEDLLIKTNNTDRMRIMRPSYNSNYPTVGIGTNSPVIHLDGGSAVLHVHDGGNSVGSQLILSTHSTTVGARAGVLYFAATQATNDRRTAGIQSYLTAYSSGNVSGDLRFITNNNNIVAERMRLYETGQLVLSDNSTFPSPTANFLFTIKPTTNNYRSGISIPMSGATSTAYAINVSTANANSRGYFYENTSGSNGVFYGVGSRLSSTNIASGYLGYRNSSGLTYGVYGINGTNATYTTNANVWAAFIQGRAVISSESSPTSPLGVDLEIRNTTTGSGNPATLSMRQTTSETASGKILAQLNFGDNHTTAPQAQISILREAAGGSGDYPTAILFSTTADASNTLQERMRITNSGRVGIGTTTPSARLHVAAAGAGNHSIIIESPLAKARLTNYNFDATTSFDISGTPGSTSRLLSIHASNANQGSDFGGRIFEVYGHNGSMNILGLSVLNNGDVGIGTNNPLTKLEVFGGSLLVRNANSDAIIRSVSENWGNHDVYVYHSSSFPAFVGLRGRGTINSPSYPLQNDILAHFSGRDAIDGYIPSNLHGGGIITVVASQNWTNSNKGAFMNFFTTPNNSNLPLERMRITEGGNLCVGLTAPAAPYLKLDVNGWISCRSDYGDIVYMGGDNTGNDGQMGLASTSRNNLKFYNPGISADNNLYAQSFNVTSDTTLKENIQSIKYGLNEVMRLHPISFQYKKGDNNRKRVGLIAQELEQLMPELVDRNEHLYVHYMEYTAVLTKAIQEQQAIIEKQNKEIEELKNASEELSKINEIKAELEKIKKYINMHSNEEYKKETISSK